jgi:hypothetical protein
MNDGATISANCLTPILDVRDFAEAMSYYAEKTLTYIRTLKEKHGIDYDTHASYRFVGRTG